MHNLWYNEKMDLTSPKIIKDILNKYETRPSKGLGQNFLIDKNVLEKIIQAADIKPTDTILEIGPGIGALTQALAEKAGKVIAVEKDETMVKILTDVLSASNIKNVQLVNADILKIDVLSFKFQASGYKVVSNIPYYITAPLIRKFLEDKNQPKEIILMLQKEVAQRICASPPTNFGNKKAADNGEEPNPKLVGGKMSLLAVSVQFYADAKIISYVSKSCFHPAPKVDSAIIKITPYGHPVSVDPNLFFKIVKAGFSQPRKQLASNLSKMLKIEKEKTNQWLLKNGIKPTQRAETLSVGDWQNLTKTTAMPGIAAAP